MTLKHIYSFTIIITFSFLGELMNHFLPFPIPASVYGLLLLFLALRFGLVRSEKVEDVGSTMVSLLPFLFVAPVVNLLDCWDVVSRNLWAIVGIVLLSTVLVFGISGKVTQFIMDRKGDK